MEKLDDGRASAAAARPRAAVCMWGLLRSVEWTWDSLKTNVIESVEEMGFTPDIFIHTYSSHKPYTNEWASESSDRLLDPRLLGLIPYHTAVLEDKEAALSKLGELIKLLKTKSPWFGSSPECAAENFVLALHSLDRVTRVTSGHDYSVFIFVRPDTLILQPLDLDPALFCDPPCLFLPEHARPGNYDDRFCVCSPAKASVYGSRIHALPDLLGNPNPPKSMQRGNSEALLFQLLRGHVVHQIPFSLRRIRIGGRMADRESGTIRADIPRLFERVYGRVNGTTLHPDCLDPAWASRKPDAHGFPVEGKLRMESFPFSPAATAPFVLSICHDSAHPPPQASSLVEHLEIQPSPSSGSRVVVVSCTQSHGSPRVGFWACGSLEVALLEMGTAVKNLRHRDPRLHSIQQRFVDFAWRFDFARSMAAVSNLVCSLRCRSFACVGIPDVRKILVTVTNPNTIDACVMMALIHGLALGRVYRPRADESTCQPRCVVQGPSSSMLFMREHTQSAYEIGMSLKRADDDDDGPPSPCCVLFVGSTAEEMPKCGHARLVIVAGPARRVAGSLGIPIFKGDDIDIYSSGAKPSVQETGVECIGHRSRVYRRQESSVKETGVECTGDRTSAHITLSARS
jgi:hypothetical protein